MKTILVVEDNQIIREDVAEILSLAGYKTYTAKDGKDGIEKIRSMKPDLVISDIIMPQMDGMSMLQHIRKDIEIRNLPFIFLSCKNEQTDFCNALTGGADGYIIKPFTGEELIDAVNKLIKKDGVRKESYA